MGYLAIIASRINPSSFISLRVNGTWMQIIAQQPGLHLGSDRSQRMLVGACRHTSRPSRLRAVAPKTDRPRLTSQGFVVSLVSHHAVAYPRRASSKAARG